MSAIMFSNELLTKYSTASTVSLLPPRRLWFHLSVCLPVRCLYINRIAQKLLFKIYGIVGLIQGPISLVLSDIDARSKKHLVIRSKKVKIVFCK